MRTLFCLCCLSLTLPALACHKGEEPSTPAAVKDDAKKGAHKAGEGMEKAGEKIEEKTSPNK